MSIRKALLSGMLAIVIISTSIVGVINILSLEINVRREAQERVNLDLNILLYQYEGQLSLLAKSYGNEIEDLSPDMDEILLNMEKLKQKYGFTVINMCDAEGNPIAGNYPDKSIRVPIVQDPVLRRALEGKLSWGTVKLDSKRLALEGGVALKNAVIVKKTGEQSEPATTSALFWWIASPVKDDEGRVLGLLYGGRTLNYNFDFVDNMRNLLFGSELYGGKPIGTVTIFLDGVRISTNVLGPGKERAVGTLVSREVYEKVIEQKERWHQRAWVVDEWYISGYHPLTDPYDQVIGMLYVGLLEGPYNALKTRQILKIILPIFLILFGAVLLTLKIVNRITSPLNELSDEVVNLSLGNWKSDIGVAPTFSEINNLSRVFKEMKTAIAERDNILQEKNRILGETNEKLNRTNRNYIEMLGFITHELKSPLAAIQTMISVLLDGYAGDIPDQIHQPLVRIKRNSEELQDMVKNYLDFSRAERGEMEAQKTDIDFISDVVDPAVNQTSLLFSSRNISLEVNSPKKLNFKADPELMGIALSNFLANAAKYGKEEGKARLEVKEMDGHIEIMVWNEGHGFTPEGKEKLFKRFSRIFSPETRDKRGSGLGLFLCKQIIELHEGKVWAESEYEKWASFHFRIPID
ncbi:cache domain-containing protein [Candidatus Latescibacterota bacterium]